MGAPPKIGIADPVKCEQRAFRASNLSQRHGEPVLVREGREAAQHSRGRHGAGVDGCREPE